MSATRDLIAAAISAADELDNIYCTEGVALRELAAQAMVQPDMAEVERLLYAHESAVRAHAIVVGEGIAALATTRTALLDYVRQVSAAPQPVSEVPMPEPMSDQQIKELIDGVDFKQMVTADDVFFLIARACEAAGYAAGVAAGVAALVALKPQSGVTHGGTAWLLPISRQDCVEAVAALRGEVK